MVGECLTKILFFPQNNYFLEVLNRQNKFFAAKAAYQKAYEQILAKATTETDIYTCFQLLADLLSQVNDQHNMVYTTFDKMTAADSKDSEKLAAFKKGVAYQIYPDYVGDLDKLAMELGQKKEAAIEGIYQTDYQANGDMEIGVVKVKNGENLNLVVLETQSPIWSKGEIMGQLKPYPNASNKFFAAVGLPDSKQMLLYREVVENGNFAALGLSKDSTKVYFSDEAFPDTTYMLITLADDIQYIKIGSFKSFYPTLKEAEDFYKTLSGKLTASNLIIDLRSNGGGGDRNSNILWKFLKKNYKKKNVYVLTNSSTASNAEQFALRLKSFKNSTILGQTTSGTLAYELGNESKLPSGYFNTFLTFKGFKKYIPYEGIGVKPAVILDNETDWVEQVQRMIEGK